jgi:hypothetical protein
MKWKMFDGRTISPDSFVGAATIGLMAVVVVVHPKWNLSKKQIATMGYPLYRIIKLYHRVHPKLEMLLFNIETIRMGI